MKQLLNKQHFFYNNFFNQSYDDDNLIMLLLLVDKQNTMFWGSAYVQIAIELCVFERHKINAVQT